MIVAMLTAVVSGAWAEKITDYTNIVSGKKYYIGATTGGTDYYLSVDGSSTTNQIAGTAITDASSATVFTFSGNGTSWSIQFESGYYLSLKSSKDNGKVQVVEDATTFTAFNQTDKSLLRLTIGSYSIQKNNTGTQFGSYGNTQTDIWLEEVAEASPLASIAVDASGATTIFHVGDEFTHEGAVVTATYEDQSTKDVTANATFSTPDMTSAGTKTITVSYTENEVTKDATYDITVNAPATLTSITLSGTYPTEFQQGAAFSSEGIVVTAHYDDQTTQNVTADAEFSGYDMSVIGAQTVTVTYGGKTATYSINVAENNTNAVTYDFSQIEDLSTWGTTYSKHVVNYAEATVTFSSACKQTSAITNIPVTKGQPVELVLNDNVNSTISTVSFECAQWTTKAQTITLYYSTDRGETYTTTGITSTNFSISSDDLPEGTNALRLNFSNASNQIGISSVTFTLETGAPKVLSSIALSGEYPTTFHVGDAFSHEGMIVTATYEGGKTADVTTSATFSTPDMTTTGTKTITVSYTENEVTKTATYDITVNAPATLTSITLSGTYPTEFQQGDAFSSEGIIVTANYDDQTTQNVTADAEFSGYDMSLIGDQTVTVTYNGKTATYNINVAEKKGTETNPYTVAEARAAIDAGDGVTGVYATGIVSGIVTEYSETYHNISYNISADGLTTSDQLQAYRGKSYNGDNFTSADDIQVGDVVVVYGDLTKYNSTYEFAAGNQLVSLDRPVNTNPTITVNPATIEAIAAGAYGTITVTYNNITNVVAEVNFCDANGDDATYNWITASINNENNVEYLIEENTSTEARTAYFKVYALDDETNDVYSNLVTVTQAGFAVDYATVPFYYNSGRADIENTSGLAQSGLGTDYSGDLKLKFDTTGDNLILKINEPAGGLAFSIKGNGFSGGTFTLQTSEDGETYTDLKTYTEFGNAISYEHFSSIDESVRYIKWIYTTKSSGNVGLGNISVCAMPYIRKNLTAGNWGTICLPYAANIEGATLYSIEGVDDTANPRYISLEDAATAEAGVPYIFEATESTLTATYTSAELTEAQTVNGLVGSFTGTSVAEGMYILSGGKIVKCGTGCTIGANKAYIDMSLVPTTQQPGVKSIAIADLTDGINTMENGQLTMDNAIFNIAGQRINNSQFTIHNSQLRKGIYIVNGKKVVVK